MGDERLAQEAGAGSERAFTALFQRYHQPLYRYCRGLTGSDQDAQDALQTTFTKALIALRQGRRNAPLRPWLYRIAHNEAITVIRGRNSAMAEIPLDLAASQGVTDSAEERERMVMLVADLRELPEQQRGALVMRELSGLSHEEIAAALGLSVGAAKQSILEARRSLLEFAEGRAMTCDEIQRIVSDDDRRSLRSRRVRAHMRDCAVCAAFAEAIPRRRADMLALWPVLPAASSAGLLAHITGAGSGHGGGGAGLVAGSAAKGIGATISIKAATVTTVAVLASAGVGAVAVLHHAPAAAPSSAVAHHKTSVSGQGSAVSRAAASTHHSTSNHQAIGKGLGPAAKHAAGHGSHGKGTGHKGSNNGHHGGPSVPVTTRTTGPTDLTKTTGSGKTVTTGPHTKTVTTGSGKTKTTGSAKTKTTGSGRTFTTGPHRKTVTNRSHQKTVRTGSAKTRSSGSGRTTTAPVRTTTGSGRTTTGSGRTTTGSGRTTTGSGKTTTTASHTNTSAATPTRTTVSGRTRTAASTTTDVTTTTAAQTTPAAPTTVASTTMVQTTAVTSSVTSTDNGNASGGTPSGQTVTSASGKNSK